MAQSNKKTNFTIVVESFDKALEKEVSYQVIYDFLKTKGEVYSIIHDRDYDTSTGEVKRKHYHYVFSANDRTRKETLLNSLTKLGYTSTIYTIQDTTNLTAMIRYLMHLDSPSKTIYTPMEVQTTNSDKLDLAIRYSYETITADSLMTAIKFAKGNKWQVMKSIGLENYNRYRNAIRDIIDEFYKNNI